MQELVNGLIKTNSKLILNEMFDMSFLIFSFILRIYSSKCTEVYYNRVIEKPTYDEVELLNSIICFPKELKLSEIPNDVSVVFGHLSSGDRQLLIDAVTQVFKECIDNRL